jgi:hypothetical protein
MFQSDISCIIFSPEVGGNILLRNAGIYLQAHKTLQHKRLTPTSKLIIPVQLYFHKEGEERELLVMFHNTQNVLVTWMVIHYTQ